MPGPKPMCEDLGWVAFDPANGICATDAYVRVAVGLDYLGAAPVRGTRFGGGSEALAVRSGSTRRPGRTRLSAATHSGVILRSERSERLKDGQKGHCGRPSRHALRALLRTTA